MCVPWFAMACQIICIHIDIIIMICGDTSINVESRPAMRKLFTIPNISIIEYRHAIVKNIAIAIFMSI